MKGLDDLRELVAVMKDLGLMEAALPGGLSARLAVVPRPSFTPAMGERPVMDGCECTHPLSRHTPDGKCLHRFADSSMCLGKCRKIEGRGSHASS